MLQQRIIRFLLDQSRKDPEKYVHFFEDYGLFIREGIITSAEQDIKVKETKSSDHSKIIFQMVPQEKHKKYLLFNEHFLEVALKYTFP